jgi:hypothetical protein
LICFTSFSSLVFAEDTQVLLVSGSPYIALLSFTCGKYIEKYLFKKKNQKKKKKKTKNQQQQKNHFVKILWLLVTSWDSCQLVELSGSSELHYRAVCDK